MWDDWTPLCTLIHAMGLLAAHIHPLRDPDVPACSPCCASTHSPWVMLSWIWNGESDSRPAFVLRPGIRGTVSTAHPLSRSSLWWQPRQRQVRTSALISKRTSSGTPSLGSRWAIVGADTLLVWAESRQWSHPSGPQCSCAISDKALVRVPKGVPLRRS